MRLRGAVTVWCAGACAALSGSLAVAHHADHGEVRRCEPAGAARHRHQRRLAQSARARVHERHARERRHRELGRRAREHGVAQAQRLAARHAAPRRRDRRQRPGGARRLASGVGRERHRVGDPSPGLQRQRYRAESPAVAAPDAARRRRQAAARLRGRRRRLLGLSVEHGADAGRCQRADERRRRARAARRCAARRAVSTVGPRRLSASPSSAILPTIPAS